MKKLTIMTIHSHYKQRPVIRVSPFLVSINRYSFYASF